MARFRRLLLVSPFADPRCQEIDRWVCRDKFIESQTYIFASLMDAGEFRREDPAAVAAEFYGPIFMLLHTCDTFEEARPAVRVHVEQFRKNYGRRQDLV